MKQSWSDFVIGGAKDDRYDFLIANFEHHKGSRESTSDKRKMREVWLADEGVKRSFKNHSASIPVSWELEK